MVMSVYYKIEDDDLHLNYHTIQNTLLHDDKYSNGNIPRSPTPAVNLDDMPILVLHTIVSHLDLGHVIPLIQVNRRLRYSLTSDNGYWVFLLRTRLNVKLTGKRRDNAVLEFIMRLPTLRCADCHTMQLPRRPFFEPFWNRPLCDVCRMDDKYRVVTAYT